MQDSNAGQSTACDVAVGWFAIFLSGCRLLPFMSMNGCGSIPFHSIAQASFRVDPKAYERRTQGNPKLCRFLSVHSYMSSEKHECQPRFRYGLPLSFYRFKRTLRFTARKPSAVAAAAVPCRVFGKDPPEAAPRVPPAGVCKRRPPWFCTGAKSRCRSSARTAPGACRKIVVVVVVYFVVVLCLFFPVSRIPFLSGRASQRIPPAGRSPPRASGRPPCGSSGPSRRSGPVKRPPPCSGAGRCTWCKPEPRSWWSPILDLGRCNRCNSCCREGSAASSCRPPERPPGRLAYPCRFCGDRSALAVPRVPRGPCCRRGLAVSPSPVRRFAVSVCQDRGSASWAIGRSRKFDRRLRFEYLSMPVSSLSLSLRLSLSLSLYCMVFNN